MRLNDAIRSELKKLCLDNGITEYELAKKSGVKRNTLNNFMNLELRYISLNKLYRLIRVFDLSLSKFFSDSIFKDVSL